MPLKKSYLHKSHLIGFVCEGLTLSLNTGIKEETIYYGSCCPYLEEVINKDGLFFMGV